MAAVRTQLLTLLDPDDDQVWTEAEFDRQLFVRFNDNQQCLTHLQTLARVATRWIHFFLPDSELHLVGTSIRDFNDTFLYLYCRDQQAVDLNSHLQRESALSRIFIIDDLPFYMRNAAIELLYSLSREAPEQSPEREELVSATVNHVQELRDTVVRAMSIMLGVQPAGIEHND